MDSSGVYLSGIFHGTFPKAVYSTMIAEKFQIYSVKITGKYICESKKKQWNLSIFTHASKQISLSLRFLSVLSRQKEITHSYRTAFSEDLFFP